MAKKSMEAKIKEKSEAWKQAIANEVLNFLPYGWDADSYSVYEQLQLIFDDEVGQETDEQFRRRVTRQYDLHVCIEKNDICHLSATAKEALALCEEISTKLPNNFWEEFNIRSLNKKAYGFAERGEQAVFQVFHNCNAAIVELQVRTEVEDEKELIYWSKDKIFIMSFVPALDEEHSISAAQGCIYAV